MGERLAIRNLNLQLGTELHSIFGKNGWSDFKVIPELLSRKIKLSLVLINFARGLVAIASQILI